MFYNKQIHRDEFRLRLLITDGCNLNCSFCLNDFQEKPSSPKFMDELVAHEAVTAYTDFAGDMNFNRIVTISGGEPGLHPELRNIVLTCHGAPCKLNLNTNGLAFKAFRKTFHSMVDSWRVGTDKIDPNIVDDLKRVNGMVQIIVTRQNILILDHIVGYYYDQDIPVKLFIDFKEDEFFTSVFENAVNSLMLDYPTISTRFSGIQENRGKLCDNCTKKCVTLKAMWVLPTGEVRSCPQEKGTFPKTKVEWEQAVRNAYENHLVKD